MVRVAFAFEDVNVVVVIIVVVIVAAAAATCVMPCSFFAFHFVFLSVLVLVDDCVNKVVLGDFLYNYNCNSCVNDVRLIPSSRCSWLVCVVDKYEIRLYMRLLFVFDH